MKKLATLLMLSIILTPLALTAVSAQDEEVNYLFDPDALPEDVRNFFENLGLEEPTGSTIIIFLAILIIIFMTIFNSLDLMPFFKAPAALWIGSLAVTLLLVISKGIGKVTDILFSFSDIFEFVEKIPAGATLFSIVFLLIVGAIISFIIKTIERFTERETIGEMELKGQKVKSTISIFDAMKGSFKK